MTRTSRKNRKHCRRLFAASLLCLSLPAAAEFVTVAEAYEVALSEMVVPVTSSDSIIFKECEDCETRMIRMTQETLFILNGDSISLQEFRQQISQIQNHERVPVTIKHHLKSDSLFSVSVTFR